MKLGFSQIEPEHYLHASPHPLLHLVPAFQPKATVPVVSLSYLTLRRTLVYQETGAGTHQYPLLRSPGTPSRVFDHH